jgi:hypothetical protein
MSLKLKAFGLSVLAAMAVSAITVMNAAANGEGHFVSEVNSTHLTGFESLNHRIHSTNHGLSGESGCNTTSYTATATAATFNSLTVTPSYANCLTTSTNTNIPVHVNGCTYTFTVAKGTTNNTEQTVHLLCPAGKKIETTHPSCTVSTHPQTLNTGLTYTHITENGKNAITLDLNLQFATTRHGACQLIAPTNGQQTLKGSLTLKGFNGPVGPQVSITAT